MEILRSDKNSVAVYKESGIPSQPDKSGQTDMTALLKAEIGGEIYCVHRLDTPTAGVMVYARSSRRVCCQRLSRQMTAASCIWRR